MCLRLQAKHRTGSKWKRDFGWQGQEEHWISDSTGRTSRCRDALGGLEFRSSIRTTDFKICEVIECIFIFFWYFIYSFMKLIFIIYLIWARYIPTTCNKKRPDKIVLTHAKFTA